MRARRSVLLASLALSVSALAHAPAASAHDALVGSTPTAGSTVPKAPDAIVLTFNEKVLGIGSRMSVKEPGGQTRTLTPTVTGAKVSAPFTDGGNGSYTVSWRVTSSDGHPVSGHYAFTLKASGVNASATPATSGGGSLATLSASPSSVTGPSTPTTNRPGDNEPALVIGGAILGALALAGAFVVARRRTHDDPH